MTFDNALKMLRQGINLTRLGWDDPKKDVRLIDGRFHKNVMWDTSYKLVPYLFNHEDLLAQDWEVTRQK